MRPFLRRFVGPIPLAALGASAVSFWATGLWWLLPAGVAAGAVAAALGRRREAEPPPAPAAKQIRPQLRSLIEEKNRILEALYGAPPLDPVKIHEEYAGHADRLRPFVDDAVAFLNDAMDRRKRVLFEGAQGSLLDIDFGTYPYVTSSNSDACGISAGAGVPPKRVGHILGVAKAYCTRVGEGPFPTELHDAVGEKMREVGSEFGATTGRPRRCGWFDAVAVRHAVRVNAFDTLAVTKLDVLDELDSIPVCTGYRFEGETLAEMPSDTSVLEACEPVYEALPGWKTPTVGLRDWTVLPEKARCYLQRLSELVGAEIGLVSTGPDRDQTVIRGRSALASWFD